MDASDAATGLVQSLEKLPGMLHTAVNYAAGLAFVAYDTQQLQRPSIRQAIQQLGHKPLTGTAVSAPVPEETDEHEDEHEDHDHGSAPAFLPHRMQERWTLILVALAGLFFLAGWLGETFFNLPENI
ncbi:MAG: heavy-metal-associated domain-containing protein, partial [Anaerolineae bacterium]